MADASIDVAGLTAEQKLALIDELWFSLDQDEHELTPEQRAELDRRLECLDRDGPVGTSWEALRTEMSSATR